MNYFQGGVWPVMITPFTKSNHIDYEGLRQLVEWYIENGVNGLFAVCQSSEMFELNLNERVLLAAKVKEYVAGRIPVIASGHISDDLEEQISELNAISKTGVDAVILITNRMAQENEGDDVWIQRTQYLIDHIAPHVKLGLYECPYPYKRLMSEKTIRWCINTGRFYFLKDTSSDIDNLKMKLNICAESKLKLYNANTATLLDSLHLGAYGYCGVMANIHPRLYNILYDNRNNRAVQELSEFLTISALIERQCYPLNAKYYLQLEGVPIELKSRLQETKALTKTYKKEVEMLKELSDIVEIEWGIKHEKKDI